VRIADRLVGDGHPCFVVAEIGINHNGSVEIARRLIDAAVSSGCDAVKFQKRTVETLYSAEELARPRDSPFGTTNGDLKRGLEFGLDAFREIDRYCRKKRMPWFASCWDEASVDFVAQFDVPCYKIASATLTDDGLLRRTRSIGRPIMLSTGMSTLAQVDHAVDVLGREDLIVLQSTSSYPASYDDLDLRVIPTFRQRFGVPVGYSGHETGLCTTVASVALGACVVERHITLDRALWGSDQPASVEPQGFTKLVRDIRLVERAMGDGVKRLHEAELPVLQKLRQVDSSRGDGK
jgi:N-acetylneuraminate synthase